MASILRQIVAGPRARHPEAGLDLCYVTDNIIATSGPSDTYPQRAYRNPLDRLVGFLDEKHAEDWAIWEFRAEGTGYPDESVYGRIRHYPWPDHHPPPFRLVPMIMASMRNWLHGGELHDAQPSTTAGKEIGTNGSAAPAVKTSDVDAASGPNKKRVVVVHCKAGKGRSGSVSCSYLISEEGWTAEDALARFTQRRMRPQFGAGVSIPSQLRWISYVDRWTRGGKRYTERPVEIVEIHVWGMRNGVRVDVAGFADEGKRIDVLHTFAKDERVHVEGDAPTGGGLSDMLWEMAGYTMKQNDRAPEEAELADSANAEKGSETPPLPPRSGTAPPQPQTAEEPDPSAMSKLKSRTIAIPDKISDTSRHLAENHVKSPSSDTPASSTSNLNTEPPSGPEPGGMSVVLRPKTPILVPTSDVNISVERRNRSHKRMGVTMVSAVAHVWFNAFFEGSGPEMATAADKPPHDSGVFAIEWNAMDGIKGSSRKGARAMDRIAVVWRLAGSGDGATTGSTAGAGTSSSVPPATAAATAVPAGEVVVEPAVGEPVPEVRAADWKGAAPGSNTAGAASSEKDLGLRPRSDQSQNVSCASSVISVADDNPQRAGQDGGAGDDADGTSFKGVKTSGPSGEDLSQGRA